MGKTFKAKITVFHCINAYTEKTPLTSEDYEADIVKMPCSGMTTDVFMLKAFESGADAVVVLVCPEGACRYLEGSIRARKRVTWTQKILDEIGVDGRRLSIHNVTSGDNKAVKEIIDATLVELVELGQNPAA